MSQATKEDILCRLKDCTADELLIALTTVGEIRKLNRYGGHGELTLVFKHGKMVEWIHKHTRRV